jgi:flagellar biosynthesis/type III secretory pathway M-ring protein FliF/YscJ
MYTVYQKFREGTGQNVTLRCDSPADLRGESWDVLEERCKPTVTTPQPAVTDSTANTTAVSTSQPTDSTANTTAVSTSQPTQFNATVQQTVLVEASSSDDSHSPSPSLVQSPSMFIVICVVSLAVVVFIAFLVVIEVIRRLKRRTRQLNRLWWEDVVARKELMSN